MEITVNNRKLLVYLVTSRGLFSEINNLFLAKHYAEKHGYDLKIDLETKKGLRGDLYFSEGVETYFDLSQIETFKPNHEYQHTMIAGGCNRNQDQTLTYNFSLIRRKRLNFRITRKIAQSMPFSTRLQHDITVKIAQLQLPEKYYFFHIRRGDKLQCEAKFIPISAFFDKLDSKGASLGSVYIATDDYSVIDEAKSYLRGRKYQLFHLIKQEKKGHNTLKMNQSEAKFTYDEVATLLTEVEISKHADLTLCTFSSNVGRYLKLVNDRPDTVISLDHPEWVSG